MPGTTRYDPDNVIEADTGRKELDERQRADRLAWEYYEGKHKKHLKVRQGEFDDNVTINLFKQNVDRTVSFMGNKFPQLEIDQAKETEDEQWLRTAWRKNQGTRLLMNLVKSGCISGHCYVKVMPPVTGAEYPRLAALNPSNMLVWWHEADVETVLYYQLFAGRIRQDIVRVEGGGWIIREFEKRMDGAKYELRLEEEWPWPIGPIVDWQHLLRPARYYGQSEADGLALNDAVNKARSDTSRILRFHASPRTVATGVESGQAMADSAIDTMYTIANENAKVYNLEMLSDLTSLSAHAEALAAAYLAQARVVILKGDVADFQRVTNLGMRALFIDMLAKIDELRLTYEDGIARASQVALMLGGKEYDVDVTCHWADPLPVDPREKAQVLELQRQMGVVSQETAAREMGRDWELEQQRMAGDLDMAAETAQRMLQQ